MNELEAFYTALENLAETTQKTTCPRCQSTALETNDGATLCIQHHIAYNGHSLTDVTQRAGRIVELLLLTQAIYKNQEQTWTALHNGKH